MADLVRGCVPRGRDSPGEGCSTLSPYTPRTRRRGVHTTGSLTRTPTPRTSLRPSDRCGRATIMTREADGSVSPGSRHWLGDAAVHNCRCWPREWWRNKPHLGEQRARPRKGTPHPSLGMVLARPHMGSGPSYSRRQPGLLASWRSPTGGGARRRWGPTGIVRRPADSAGTAGAPSDSHFLRR